VNTDGKAVLLKETDLITQYPNIWVYLKKYRSLLGARDKGKWKNRSDWYAYARSQNISTFLGSKFLVPYMTTRLRLNLDSEGKIFLVNITTGGYGLRILAGSHSQKYLLGLLNSSLLNYCARQMTNQFRGGYFAVNKQMLERLPIRTIDFSDHVDVQRHDQMASLVERMLTFHQQLANSNTPTEKTLLQRQIDTTDRQIDAMVYELYGLTEEEIRLVEGS
jgi:hypothetical protein